jgi:hypothetical protein
MPSVRKALAFLCKRDRDLTPGVDDLLKACLDVVDPDVHEHARVTCRLPLEHPFAAHMRGRVVERDRPVDARSRHPAECVLVEGGRGSCVGRRDLQIANLGASTSSQSRCVARWTEVIQSERALAMPRWMNCVFRVNADVGGPVRSANVLQIHGLRVRLRKRAAPADREQYCRRRRDDYEHGADAGVSPVEALAQVSASDCGRRCRMVGDERR